MSNYRKRFYANRRPYLVDLVDALKSFGMTDFEDREFWTLGGKEWHEFKFLSKNLNFGKGSYHNVDRSVLDPLKDGRVSTHVMDFMDIAPLFHRPGTIAFDSTSMLVKSNRPIMVRLAVMAEKACMLSREISLHANFMVSRANCPAHKHEDDMLGEYHEWLKVFVDNVSSRGMDHELYRYGSLFQMSGSKSKMLGMHWKLRRSK